MKSATFKKFITNSLAVNEKDFQENKELRESLKPLIGKTVTVNRVEKLIPKGWTVKGYGVTRFEVVSPRERTHCVCSTSDMKEEFNLAMFDHCNSPYRTGAHNRMEKLEKLLNNEETFNEYLEHYRRAKKIAKLAEELKEKEPKSYNFYNPCHYEIINDMIEGLKIGDREKEDLNKLIR